MLQFNATSVYCKQDFQWTGERFDLKKNMSIERMYISCKKVNAEISWPKAGRMEH